MFKKRWGQPTTTIGLISHKNINFARAAHFFLHLPLVLHDYNDKNSTNLHVTRFTEEMYVFLFTSFSLQLIFTLVAASISHFLTAAIKFSCFSSEEIGLRYFNSRSFAAKTRGVLEMQTFTPSNMKG